MNMERSTVVNRMVIPVALPGRIRVVPWGEVAGTNGDFLVDQESANSIIQAFNSHGVDLPIDRDHATLGGEYAPPDGAAPAMGWIKSLEVVAGDGIFAVVEWTASGAEYVQSKEYRYLSPVIDRRLADGRAVRLHSVALTNTPAIRGMNPIVNSAAGGVNTTVHHQKEKRMDALNKALGLADGADEKACVEAVGELKAASAAVAVTAGVFRETICNAAGVEAGKVDDGEIVTVINSLKGDAAKSKSGDKTNGDVIPKAEHEVVVNSLNATNAKLAELESRLCDRDAAERIANAQQAGKLTAAMLEADAAGKNHFRELARDGKAWNAFIERQPVVAPPAGKVVANSAAQPSLDGAGGSRTSIIANAKTEYNGLENTVPCSRQAYINECLREQGQGAMDDAETKTHAA